MVIKKDMLRFLETLLILFLCTKICIVHAFSSYKLTRKMHMYLLCSIHGTLLEAWLCGLFSNSKNPMIAAVVIYALFLEIYFK